VRVRPVAPEDFEELFELVSAVAAEGKWIGAELPLDRDAMLLRWRGQLDDPAFARFVAEEHGRLIGDANVTLQGGRADFGIEVARDARGRGVGAALLTRVVEWARGHDAHKVTLQMWPHNDAARRLYERFGFVEDGRLRRHYRRKSGELWDAVVMGLVLDETSPGSRFADGG
jgi:RimJ/RimL family protein N-acetyltransferase